MNLLTAKELAKKLGVTIGTVYRMVRSGIIPAVRIGIGRSLRFDFEEVKAALSKPHATSPLPQREATKDPLLALHELAIETGIKDLAQNHDHYLYGIPIKPVVSPSKR
jgi:excisionase family DNA binding protein